MVINAVGFISQVEKTQHFVRHARYGYNIVVNSAFESLERDDKPVRNSSATTCALMNKPDGVLHNLIEIQQRLQFRTHCQLAAIEKQFHKVMLLLLLLFTAVNRLQCSFKNFEST